MKAQDGITVPIWTKSIELPEYPAPDGGVHAEVIVVGAGISGLTSAYLLAKQGMSVMVLDEGRIGSGQTERTSAHLASIIDDRFAFIEKQHDEETSRLAHESHATAINKIEQIIHDEEIACDFTRLPAYFFAGPDGDEKELDDEFEPAKRAGAQVQIVKTIPALPHAGRGLRFDNQARFHPCKYLRGLAKACESAGVKIYTGRRVSDVKGADPKNDAPARVTFHDNEQVLTADHVVVATNVPTPINDWVTIYLKQAAYRTYMVGLQVPVNAVPDALYWDTADPYHYARLLGEVVDGYDTLLVGGADHKTGQGADASHFDRLVEWTRAVFPEVGKETCRWSGQVVEPVDGLGFIGIAPTSGERVYVITGDSGMGLTHGTLGAMLIADLIAGRDNPWQKIYDPSRTPVNTELLSEIANTTKQYVDYISSGEIKSESDLEPGQGGIMRSGLSKLALYRDHDGKIHRMSAVCPHLKCIVHWNGVEKSWDCPCHGSRFDCTGRVVMGPAFSNLPDANQ